MGHDQRSFWTTMPGILTGVVSLLTAIVGLVTVLHKSAPPAAPAPVAFVPYALPSQIAVKPQGCEKAIGNWSWFIGGVVTFEKDGHIVWRKDPKDLFPTANGVWNCIDAQEQEMTLTWQQSGMTDTVKISHDGRSISGSNYTGIRVSGSKL